MVEGKRDKIPDTSVDGSSLLVSRVVELLSGTGILNRRIYGNKLRTTTNDDRAEKLALGCVNKDVHVYLRNAKKEFH